LLRIQGSFNRSIGCRAIAVKSAHGFFARRLYMGAITGGRVQAANGVRGNFARTTQDNYEIASTILVKFAATASGCALLPSSDLEDLFTQMLRMPSARAGIASQRPSLYELCSSDPRQSA
jgi:hypothetical protein